MQLPFRTQVTQEFNDVALFLFQLTYRALQCVGCRTRSCALDVLVNHTALTNQVVLLTGERINRRRR